MDDAERLKAVIAFCVTTIDAGIGPQDEHDIGHADIAMKVLRIAVGID